MFYCPKCMNIYNITKSVKGVENTQNNMFFFCKYCGNYEIVKDGTIIISKDNSKTITDNNFDVKEYLNMQILPRTRDYNCPNDKCQSHKNPEKKIAVFMRINGTYKIRYICETCETIWQI